MGLKISNLFGQNKKRIVMVSLYGAGKTTILYRLLGQTFATMPTTGCNLETMQYNNLFLTIWDFGSGEKIQPLWEQMYSTIKAHALIFVVDSNDRQHICESVEKLHDLLRASHFRNTILLLFANKQDLPDAMTPIEIAHEFRLNEMQNRRWHIQTSCAIKEEGLKEGLAWLANELSKETAIP